MSAHLTRKVRAATPRRTRTQSAGQAATAARRIQQRQLERAVSWTCRERLGCHWYRLRLTVQEANDANFRIRVAGYRDAVRPSSCEECNSLALRRLENIDMTLYVYKFEGQRGKAFTQAYPAPWYGLTADTADELHPFAESLGLNRQFYRPLRWEGQEIPQVGHYELSQGERDRAVTNGAKPMTTREHKKMLREQAAAFGIKLD